MNINRIGRTLICFLLVCGLLVNVSPIRAEAVSTGVLVAASTVVASVLIGLGISTGTDAIMHSEVVDHFVDLLDNAGGVIANGLISVTKLSTGHYGVPGSLIVDILNLLYEAEVISSGTTYEIAYDASPWGACTLTCSVPFNVAYFTKGTSKPGYIVYAEQKATVYAHRTDGSTATINVSSSGTPYYYTAAFPAGTHDVSTWDIYYLGHYTGYSSSASEIAKTFLSKLPNVIGSSITTDYDLTLGHVASPGASLATGYPAWHANSISIPNVETGEEEDYYPLALGQTMEETQSMTQTDVWAGNGTYVESVPDSGTQSGLLSDVLTAIKAIPGQFADWFADVISWGQSIWEAITALPQAIVSGIAEVLADIFIPSTDFLTAKVAAIRAEYAFADSVIATGQFIGSALTGLDVEPPVIYIHLEDTEGSYDMGGTVPFIDMTWYSRYKPTVDTLISALLWIVFAWRVFVKLPGIIAGMPGDFVMDALNHIGFADHMPSRKAEYEVQRISLREQIRRGKK